MVPIETFKFEGGRQLERNLKDLVDQAGGSRQGREAVKNAGGEALRPFGIEMATNAPVLSGNLQLSVAIGKRLTPRQARLAKKERRNYVEVYAGTSNPAGQMQEFGTAHHPAQPFGRDAWERTRFQVLGLYGKLLGKHIKAAAARLSKKLATTR